jgi:predicted transposase/invertase (TIGR01784 family)
MYWKGFLSTLLSEKVTIRSILGSQSNKETNSDKYNDVDILVENSKGELVIIEVQNTKEHDYFHRILFGAAKIITQYIQEGDAYAEVKKVISITIAYFDLGQGLDYVYHGTTSFKGYHHGDVLNLSSRQRELYKKISVHQIYPEYWIIKAGIFDEEQVHDQLDEWIYFFKMGEVQDNFTAAGLKEAKRILDRINLSEEEREEYEAYVARLHRIASRETNEMEDIKYASKKAEEKSAAEIAKAHEAITIAEQQKQKAEQKTQKAEQQKQKAEQQKQKAEQQTQKAEQQKQIAEQTMQQQLAASIMALHEHGLTMPVIAKSLGVTEERVAQIIKDALEH